MSVNGVEIKVGQVWITRGGDRVEVNQHRPGLPACWRVASKKIGNGEFTVFLRPDGREFRDGEGVNDLKFLVNDPDIKVERRMRGEPSTNQMRRKTDWPNVKPAAEPVVPDLTASPEEFAASIPGSLDAPIVRSIPSGVETVSGKPTPKSALDVQVGGSHYRDLAIQPATYIAANNMDFFSGNVVKYASRHKAKNGAADIRKAIHYCQMILEMQYGEKS